MEKMMTLMLLAVFLIAGQWVLGDGIPLHIFCIVTRPGNCPTCLGHVQSNRSCFCDQECPNAEKCCSIKGGRVCMQPDFGECPVHKGHLGLCHESCISDRNCPRSQKCCYNGCGHRCTPVVPVKPGCCPPMTDLANCSLPCERDIHCPDVTKCCRTTCGNACTLPV